MPVMVLTGRSSPQMKLSAAPTSRCFHQQCVSLYDDCACAWSVRAAAVAGPVNGIVERLTDNGTARSGLLPPRMRRTTQSATQACTFQLGVFHNIIK